MSCEARIVAQIRGQIPVMPAVIAADELFTVDDAVCQRERPVGATVLDGMEGAVDVEDGDAFAVENDADRLPRLKLFRPYGFHRGILGPWSLSGGKPVLASS